MSSKFVSTLAAGALLFSLAGAAVAQPILTNPSGGTGNAEMDHGRMGGGGGMARPGSPAPTLNNPSGGTGNADMDHSRMGGGSQGVGSPQGGRITGNSGEGGLEVQHGHNAGTIPPRTN